MRTIHRSWQYTHAGRIIDVTPRPRWQQWIRVGFRSVVWVAAIPLLLVIGGLMLLAVLGGAGAILLLGYLRYWRKEYAYRSGATRWDV